MMILSDEVLKSLTRYMNEAYQQAKQAGCLGEVPVGAVVVYKERIIVKTHNLVEANTDPTAHAEIIALKKAGQILKSSKLTEIDLYVTLEPCLMCAGAILNARINRLIFGAYDDKLGVVGSICDVIRTPKYQTDIEVIGGIMQEECSDLLKQFFVNKR